MSEFASLDLLDQWIEVSSSNLHYVRYSLETKTLQIIFEPGDSAPREYTYSGVPVDVFLELLKAPSKGKYHARHIKWVYPYVEN